MSQVTIYLPDDLHQAIRARARAAGTSVSAFMADLARRALGHEDFGTRLDELYGSCEGLVEAPDPPPDPVDF